MNTLDLSAFDTVFGPQTYRLQGIPDWDVVAHLGKRNLERLQQLAQEHVLKNLAGEHDRAELRECRHVITFLSDCLASLPGDKPLLPRLRVESFHKGEAVRVFLGDSEGQIAPMPWVEATITAVEKAFRTDWNDGTANGGYFWRWTATTPYPVFPEQDWVRFSTSEPRVVSAWEFEYLTTETSDTQFQTIFAANADRAWEPLWCLERNTHSSGAKMDMQGWLRLV